MRSLASILLLSIGLALQPCAMATDVVGEPPCPHCPPVDTHHGMPCDSGLEPTCDTADQLNHDGRFGLKDLLPALLPVPMTTGSVLSSDRISRPPASTHHPGAPPLNILHCVYLN